MTFDDGTIDWVLPPGEFIRLFRAHGFDVEDLVELRPPKGATTTYEDYVDAKWARRWPAEWIWSAAAHALDAGRPQGRLHAALDTCVTAGDVSARSPRVVGGSVTPSSRSWYLRTRPTGLRGRSSRIST